MRARYDLAHQLANFQFFNWLVMAKAAGATSIVIDARSPKTTKWGPAAVRRRIDSIIVPGARLAGLSAEFGNGGEDLGPSSHYVERLTAYVRGGGRFERLASALPAGGERYTVTLRRTERAVDRNSNEPAWRAFAAEIGARVIEDWDVAPIDLLERVALYAGAAMNFFVCNGPMHLCSLTPYPMMVFGCPAAEGSLARIGVRPGEHLPWALEHQRLVWEQDELPSLRRAFDSWKKERA